MTTTSPEQLVCSCGTGPNIARCQAGHLEPTNAKKGNRTRCPHRVDGVRCAQLSTALSDRQVSKILGPPPEAITGAADDDVFWTSEAPPANWRKALRGPDSDPSGCDSPECQDAGCDGSTWRRTSEGTGIVCVSPDCDPRWCWDLSSGAMSNLAKYRQGQAEKSARNRTASPELPQRELDERDRQHKRRRQIAQAVVAKVLADPHLTPECRSDFEWFADQIQNASADRLAGLEEQIHEQPVDRAGWLRRSFARGEIRDYLEWAAQDGPEHEDHQGDGDVVDAELVDDDDKGPEPLTTVTSPYLGPAGVPAGLPVGQGFPAFKRPRKTGVLNWRGTGAAKPSPAVQPPPELLAYQLRNRRPACKQCLDGGNRQPPAADFRILYNRVPGPYPGAPDVQPGWEWDVCDDCAERMSQGPVNVEVLGQYGQPRLAITGGR